MHFHKIIHNDAKKCLITTAKVLKLNNLTGPGYYHKNVFISWPKYFSRVLISFVRKTNSYSTCSVALVFSFVLHQSCKYKLCLATTFKNFHVLSYYCLELLLRMLCKIILFLKNDIFLQKMFEVQKLFWTAFFITFYFNSEIIY